MSLSATSSLRPPPRPPPYRGRPGGGGRAAPGRGVGLVAIPATRDRLPPYRGRPGGSLGRGCDKGQGQPSVGRGGLLAAPPVSRERYRSGSPVGRPPAARGPRSHRGRSVSVTVCQYATPCDKRIDAVKVKRRPLSLSLTPASSTSSVATASDTRDFWEQYRRGPAPTSFLQLVRQAIGLGSSRQLEAVEEPTYAEIYRGEVAGGHLVMGQRPPRQGSQTRDS